MTGTARSRRLIAGVALIAFGVLLVAGLIAGSYALTLSRARQEAATVTKSIEKERAAAAAKAQAAETASAVRECLAFRALARVRGTHAPTATYGSRLQAGIMGVYLNSGCPVLLARNVPAPDAVSGGGQ